MPYVIVHRNDKYYVHKRGADGRPEGRAFGSHATAAQAEAQRRAMYARERSESKKGGKYAFLNFTPTAAMAKNAARGLRLCAAFDRGGSEVTLAGATDIKNRNSLSPRTVRALASYFDSHGNDVGGEGWGKRADPSASYIGWLLRGGDAGKVWAQKRLDQMEEVTASQKGLNMASGLKALNTGTAGSVGFGVGSSSEQTDASMATSLYNLDDEVYVESINAKGVVTGMSRQKGGMIAYRVSLDGSKGIILCGADAIKRVGPGTVKQADHEEPDGDEATQALDAEEGGPDVAIKSFATAHARLFGISKTLEQGRPIDIVELQKAYNDMQFEIRDLPNNLQRAFKVTYPLWKLVIMRAKQTRGNAQRQQKVLLSPLRNLQKMMARGIQLADRTRTRTTRSAAPDALKRSYVLASAVSKTWHAKGTISADLLTAAKAAADEVPEDESAQEASKALKLVQDSMVAHLTRAGLSGGQSGAAVTASMAKAVRMLQHAHTKLMLAEQHALMTPAEKQEYRDAYDKITGARKRLMQDIVNTIRDFPHVTPEDMGRLIPALNTIQIYTEAHSHRRFRDTNRAAAEAQSNVRAIIRMLQRGGGSVDMIQKQAANIMSLLKKTQNLVHGMGIPPAPPPDYNPKSATLADQEPDGDEPETHSKAEEPDGDEPEAPAKAEEPDGDEPEPTKSQRDLAIGQFVKSLEAVQAHPSNLNAQMDIYDRLGDLRDEIMRDGDEATVKHLKSLEDRVYADPGDDAAVWAANILAQTHVLTE